MPPEYERHFASNRKVIAVYGSLLFETGNIEYFDAPEGEFRQGGVTAPKRRMKWGQRFLCLPDGCAIGEGVVEFLMNDGFNSGLPMGFVPGDEKRYREVLSLGAVSDGRFCQLVSYRGSELRVYNVLERFRGEFKDLPLATSPYQLRQ